MDYTEFKLGVTVWSLETPDDDKPCVELHAMCKLLNTGILTFSPAEIHPRNEPVVLKSNADPDTFLSIDLALYPTDQMAVVGLQVRCRNQIADAIHAELKKIRARSEVKMALLRGNLGLPSR